MLIKFYFIKLTITIFLIKKFTAMFSMPFKNLPFVQNNIKQQFLTTKIRCEGKTGYIKN